MNKCSYNQICRFRHEMDSEELSKDLTLNLTMTNEQSFDCTGSGSKVSINDDDKVNSTSPWPNIQSVLLPKSFKTGSEESRHPSCPPAPTLSAMAHRRFASAPHTASIEDDPEAGGADAAAASHKIKQAAAIKTQNTFCPKTLVSKIEEIEKKYANCYRPKTVNGITFSANVHTPSVDFARIRPHLYRNLPKPDPFPVHGCSQNPEFYSLCTETTASGTSKIPKFETENPFGSTPGFLTNLGIIAVPTVPIGGFIYNGGTGASTSYCLFAEADYKA